MLNIARTIRSGGTCNRVSQDSVRGEGELWNNQSVGGETRRNEITELLVRLL